MGNTCCEGCEDLPAKNRALLRKKPLFPLVALTGLAANGVLRMFAGNGQGIACNAGVADNSLPLRSTHVAGVAYTGRAVMAMTHVRMAATSFRKELVA